MSAGRLVWVGLFCCILALSAQLFPSLAFQAGADPIATWYLFGFGIFLILMATFIAIALSGCGKKRDHFDR